MKILVTGGAGFIGRWVVKNLLEKRHDVFIIDSLVRGNENNLHEFKKKAHFKDFYKVDITNKKALGNIFKEKFDVIFHLASSCDVGLSIDNPTETFKTDIYGTFLLLEESRKSNTKFVFVSTCMIYNINANIAITEESPTMPRSPYAAGKLASEGLVLSYQHAYKLPVVILRPFNTYGPFGLFEKARGEGGVINLFLKCFIQNNNLHIYGSGKQTRDFLYVENCAEYIVRIGLSKRAEGEIFNISTGRETSINELARIICKDKSRITYIKHHHEQSEIMRLYGDMAKAKKIILPSVLVSLEDGIKKTMMWLLRNRQYLKK
ncbi:MAG: hypothetical protein A3B53_02235 [Candidatus Levybacteria bacterium RIFCSPLOWO2_01_FULL_42_15]|nr:MAG: hypothetical protein A3B53_02235 [Candidatus Levybacteria bacterium RIFCSPLOWO2_01_FULL_42_15]